MTTTPFQPLRPQATPFGKDHRLVNVVPLQFRASRVKFDADARQLQLKTGDQVIVSTERGPLIATITGQVHRKIVRADELPRVLRKATDADLAQARHNETIEEQAYRAGIERIRARRLDMKLIRTQVLQDGSKIVFFFSADGRIDFRDLVKDLAHRFRTRIEMHQIGVRDGTRMLGGIGPCGRELCCSSFLDHFAPISIRMAKDQGLTLNPRKISGMCGRLMCCLVYEQKVYRRMKKRLPRIGTPVLTEEDGEGVVESVDIINQRVTVDFQAGEKRKTYPLLEVVILEKGRADTSPDFDDNEQEKILEKVPRRRTNRRKRQKSQGDAN